MDASSETQVIDIGGQRARLTAGLGRVDAEIDD